MGDSGNHETRSIRELHALWRDEVEKRSDDGGLRVAAAERLAFQQYLEGVESLDSDSRALWEIERSERDALQPSCDCGHHRGHHHDGEGSCFHIAGCATACECGRFRLGE